MESGSFRLITGIPKLKASNITDVLAARIASAFSKKEFTLPFTTSIEEMMTTTKSERTTRVIDFDQDASMEQKKREGYF